MKTILVVLFFTLVSLSVSAGELVWKSLYVYDSSQAKGYGNYLGKVDSDIIKAIASGKSAPTFVEITHMVNIDQTGVIRKVSDFPWGGGKLVSGNEMFIRVDNIITIQSINKELQKELSDFTN